MLHISDLKAVLASLDSYMLRHGKQEISDLEASQELCRSGIMVDDNEKPGKPLREFFRSLRDSNALPTNIRQRCGAWYIRLSKLTGGHYEIPSIYI